MSENKYDKKAELKLLKAIYHKYVKDQGKQPSALDVYQFNSLEDHLYEDIPEVLLEPLRAKIRPSVDSRYFTNLKDDGYIKDKHNSGICVFTLTHNGYDKAERLIHPFIYFYKDHWKWVWATIFTIINITGAILRLLQCP